MLGDALLTGIEAQLRRVLSAPVTGANGSYTTLASLGITTGTDGTLSVNATKLQTALAAGSTMVSGVLGGANGVATKLSTYLDSQLATSGQIAARTDSIAAQRKTLNAQAEAINVRMALVQARYQKQFGSLDTLLTKMQGTSDYLTKQLASLSASSSK
jgi:flagellar hook-associated protein 2